MTKKSYVGVLSAILLCAACSGASAEVGIVYYGSTGLSTDGLKGYIGENHPQDRIVISSDESPVYLLFFWDADGLQPQVNITDKTGGKVADIDLTKGNLVTLDKAGEFVLMLSARKGSGHWFCVVLSGREWDP